jgi:ATP-dependent Zn protease
MVSKMSSARDILYLDYTYQNKTSYVKPEDFDDFYSKIKEVEQKLAYYIYIPKSEVNSKLFTNTFDTDSMTSSLATIFYWIFAIVLVIGIGLFVFVVQSKKRNR